MSNSSNQDDTLMGSSVQTDPGTESSVSGHSGHEGESRNADTDTLRELLSSPQYASLSSLVALGRALGPTSKGHGPELFRRLASRFLDMDEPLFAYDVVKEGLNHWGDDFDLIRLQGFALARAGATVKANSILNDLRNSGHDDEETLGMLARTYKDLWRESRDTTQGKEYLKRAYEIYSEAYEKTGGYWPGINAATLAVIRHDLREANRLATQIFDQCERELAKLQRGGADTYWVEATLGDAELIRGNRDRAGFWYTKACKIAGKRYGHIRSTRTNARLLMRYLEGDRKTIEACFQLPRVVVFAGHMIDKESRTNPRFPATLETEICDAIRKRLMAHKPVIGYSSAACGGDILFLESVLSLGGEVRVILPYDPEDFARDSVAFAGTQWRKRYDDVLKRCMEVITVSPHQELSRGSVSYDYANQVLTGLATLHATQLDSELIPLAVWNGQPGDSPGGTASVVARWKEIREVEIIDPVALLKKKLPGLAPSPSEPCAPAVSALRASTKTKIMALLFADVKGFSKLKEEQMPDFVEHFLRLVGELANTSPDKPAVKESRGDGVYFVFEGVKSAGRFALDLNGRLKRVAWEECGLPKDFSVRIALHAGPVYEYTDPVTELRSYTGTHVTHAARIEPITPPGQVYASQAFAALASLEEDCEFTCDYVGKTPLPKGYGIYPTYHVCWHNKNDVI